MTGAGERTTGGPAPAPGPAAPPAEGLEADVRATRGRLRLAVTVAARPGEVVGVLGPNGAGKTSLLQAIAGLVPLTGGRVAVDGRVWDEPTAGVRVPSDRRGVSMLFQDHLLFPHLSTLENVAFGPRSLGVGRGEARARARAWLGRMQLAAHADDRPARLSGGQAQRVALARALAVRPRVLLLDEPLASLDVRARLEVRRLLDAHLADFAGPCLLVTHEPVEALALADRLLVVEDGRVTQTGTPAEVTGRPRSRWVAELVGVNLLPGRAAGGRVELDDGGALVTATGLSGPVVATVHPHAVSLHRQRPEGSPRNVWAGRVAGLDRHGDRVRVRVDGAPPVVAEVTPQAVADLDLGRGGPVWVSVKATEIDVQPA